MSYLTTVLAEEVNKKPSIVSLSKSAKDLIEKFESKLKENLLSDKFKSSYNSIDDILIKKYHLSDIGNLDLPDYRKKTEFISKGVRGNVQKSNGNVLSYADGEKLIEEAIKEDIP